MTPLFTLLFAQALTLVADTTQLEPVTRSAIAMLSADCQGVLQAPLHVTTTSVQGPHILLSTDPTIQREGFRLTVHDQQLQVAASDGHGLAYGLLEVSRLMGVSPWTWWADLGYQPLQEWSLPEGFTLEEAPDVDFRGIFLNDEDWGLMPWSSLTYEPLGQRGSIGPQTYSRIFELLLRLRANTIWPAMHECTEPFFLTPGNREAAARYGIYIGGSHCEPMACSAAGEGGRGVGEYDYVNNSQEVRHFWQQRLDEVSGQEILYTVGMRGVHDGAMQGAKTVEEQKAVLTRVLHDQREMLSQLGDVTQVPQVFIPYKEVLDVYNAGLEVPDDVCLMWCDDNYGYIRHFPTEAERRRSGGNGIYYHCSYWGRPHDYLWLGDMSPYLMYQQLHLGYEQGIRRIWILNVGDIKPSEYQTELFMDMAWHMADVEEQGVSGHMEQFYTRHFGPELGPQMQQAMAEWYRLAFQRKPEHLGGTRVEEADRKYWSTLHDLPFTPQQISARLESYRHLSDQAEQLFGQIPQAQRDAYFQLFKYPVQAAYQMNVKLLEAQRARHGLSDWALTDAALDSIQRLTLRYNQGYHNQAKWNRMMDWKPRNLPVFLAVPHDTLTASPQLAQEVFTLNANDFVQGASLPCPSLGYESGAIQLIPNTPVTYQLDPAATEVAIHLLPTHPLTSNRLGFYVQFPGSDPLWIDYHTEGRSEEWKQNVLRNQAIRTLPVPQGTERPHALTIWTDCEGVVLDQIKGYLFPKRNQ